MGFGAKEVVISAPNIKTLFVDLEGTSPYVQHRFSVKTKDEMKLTQQAGSVAKKGKKKEPKDFQQCYKDAQYFLKVKKGEADVNGMHAASFRCAMISACRIVNYTMTRAKLAFWILEDGYDKFEPSIPLVKFTKGAPEYFEAMVRLPNGSPDIRVRPMWQPGWRVSLRVEYDADMFSHKDLLILLHRAGRQVGIGEGRNDSPDSAGQGWGFFKIVNEEDAVSKK
jgi:hypothetical protein